MSTTREKVELQPELPTALKCLFGTTSAVIPASVVHPFEIIKVRMQISGMGKRQRYYTSTLECISELLKKEGMNKIYRGIKASIWRQAVYTTARLETYSKMAEYYKKRFKRKPTLATSVGFSMMSAAVGAFLSNPADLIIVRIAADGQDLKAEPKNYKSSWDALKRIYRDEGLRVFFRGSFVNIQRAAIVNCVQLYSYAQFEKVWRRSHSTRIKDSFGLHLLTVMMAGLMAALISSPLDLAKTRIQCVPWPPDVILHCGTYDALNLVYRQEGLASLWKGLTPYTLRVIPHTIITFCLLEYMNSTYKRFKDPGGNG